MKNNANQKTYLERLGYVILQMMGMPKLSANDPKNEDKDEDEINDAKKASIISKILDLYRHSKHKQKCKSALSIVLALFFLAWIRSRRYRKIKDDNTLKNPFYGIPVIQSILQHFYKNSHPKISSAFPNSSLSPSQETTEEVPISFLFSSLQDKNIQRAFLNTCTCIFTLRNASQNNANLPNDNLKVPKDQENKQIWKKVTFPESSALREKILSQLSFTGCDQISTLAPNKSFLSYAQDGLLYAFPFLYLGMVYQIMKKFSQDPFADKDSPLLSKQRKGKQKGNSNHTSSSTTFKDVAGIDGAKLELQEVVECLSNPYQYLSIGARAPRGVLLYGPPGAGKTLLARAVAGEAGNHCVFIACSGGDFVEVLVGRGAARVRELFARAKKEALATYSDHHQQKSWLSQMFSSSSSSISNHTNKNMKAPLASAVVFIDEIDALAKTRSNSSLGRSFSGSNDEREQTLNQLLTEMDGFYSSSTSSEETPPVTIVLFAATNRPDVLDPALLRPGRFDRHVHVGLPDRDGREAILRLHASKVQLEREGSENEVEWKMLAGDNFMKGFSGAEIENVVNEAAFMAIRLKNNLVGQSHLVEAVEKVARMKYSGLYNSM